MNSSLADAAHVELEQVQLAFGGRTVLDHFSCRFGKGEITVLLGGSGAGKTTILRLIGGLVRPQAGAIRVAGRDIVGLADRELYDVREKLGMMFQGGALLDSLSIFENLAFPLREHTRLGRDEIAAKVTRQLAIVGLGGVENLLPGQLSGGMVKRAALARALVLEPEILLCDEPFSGLDPISVKRIEALLRRINRVHGVTMLVSSHHMQSTMRMADRIVLLAGGKAVAGTPAELRANPDPWIREFLSEDLDPEQETEEYFASLDPERSPIL